jgi:hypothetical protein
VFHNMLMHGMEHFRIFQNLDGSSSSAWDMDVCCPPCLFCVCVVVCGQKVVSWGSFTSSFPIRCLKKFVASEELAELRHVILILK